MSMKTLKRIWNILQMTSIVWHIIFLLALFPVSYIIWSVKSDLGWLLAYDALVVAIAVPSYSKLSDKYNKLVQNINSVQRFIHVWTEDLVTLSGMRWGNQLSWLLAQYTGRILTARTLLPHKFFSLDETILTSLPDNVLSEDIRSYKDSLVSVNNKIQHLNFMVEKLHLRDQISDIELKEIRGLIDGNNPTGVIYTLAKELSALKTQTNCLLTKLT